MSNACSTHATKMNNVASAKYLPGQILMTAQCIFPFIYGRARRRTDVRTRRSPQWDRSRSCPTHRPSEIVRAETYRVPGIAQGRV